MAFCTNCGAQANGAFCGQCGAQIALQQSISHEPTTFEAKCKILGDFWVAHKNDDEYAEFIKYNDIGLPLAYAVDAEIVENSFKAQLFIEETFELLLGAFGLDDTGFDDLAEIEGV